MNNTYCKNCKYHTAVTINDYGEYSDWEHFCTKNPDIINDNNAIRENTETIYEKCRDKNNDNDCKDFEEKIGLFKILFGKKEKI